MLRWRQIPPGGIVGAMRKMLTLLALLPLLLLAACGGGNDHDDADVTFAQQMIPHHQQAVLMAQLAPDAGASADVTRLAAEIAGAQQPEITEMRGWLKDWGVTEMSQDMDHGDMAMGAGDGMASDADLAKLQTLRGAEFDALFLQLMTAHHEGAVTMARTEVADGKDDRATKLAREIIATQEKEIATMKDLAR